MSLPPPSTYVAAEKLSRADGPFARVLPVVVRIAAFSLAYVFSCQLGMLFRTEPEKFAIVWPPNGLLLGLLIVRGRAERVWLVPVAVGCQVAINLLKSNSLPVSLGFTAVNITEPCLIAWAWHRLGGGPGLSDARRVFALYVLALVGCAVTALPGAAVVVFGLGEADFGPTWLIFWLADAMGVILVTPMVLVWASGWGGARAGVRVHQAVEGVVLFVLLAAATALIFAEPNPAQHYPLAFPFPLFPFLLWAGLRFGLRGATLAVGVLTVTAVWFTGHGGGPFSDPAVPSAHRLLMVQAFLCTMSLSVFIMAAVVAERRRAERGLRASEERYR